MALLESNMTALKLGKRAKDFTLLGTDEKMHSLNEIAKSDKGESDKPKAIIIMFNN